MTSIAVVIPVGPKPHHQAYLQECLSSIAGQTRTADALVFVDDMAQLDMHELMGMYRRFNGNPSLPLFFIERNRWRLGVAASFNVGVVVATEFCDLAFMLGADDVMRSDCLQSTVDTYEANGQKDAYYYAGVCYMDTLEEQTVPCNEAAVTRGLWQLTGGFPPESAVGAPDCALVSIMMVHMNSRLVPIAGGRALVDYRRHAQTETASQSPAWQGPILTSRDLLTREWTPPAWNRM